MVTSPGFWHPNLTKYAKNYSGIKFFFSTGDKPFSQYILFWEKMQQEDSYLEDIKRCIPEGGFSTVQIMPGFLGKTWKYLLTLKDLLSPGNEEQHGK